MAVLTALKLIKPWLTMTPGVLMTPGPSSCVCSLPFSLFLFTDTPCLCAPSALSSLLQRPDANPGVQPRDKNCVEFGQAPTDGKDPVHPRLPCCPQDIKECKRHHLQPDPSPLLPPLPPSVFLLTFSPHSPLPLLVSVFCMRTGPLPSSE